MKVTKRQLRRIIREEKNRLLREQPISGGTTREDVAADDFLELLEAGWRRARGWGLSAQELGNITEKFIADKGYKG